MKNNFLYKQIDNFQFFDYLHFLPEFFIINILNENRQNTINKVLHSLYHICINIIYVIFVSYNDYKYIIEFIDDKILYKDIEFLIDKFGIFEVIKRKFEYFNQQFGNYFKMVRINNDNKFSPKQLKLYLIKKGAIFEFSTSYIF